MKRTHGAGLAFFDGSGECGRHILRMNASGISLPQSVYSLIAVVAFTGPLLARAQVSTQQVIRPAPVVRVIPARVAPRPAPAHTNAVAADEKTSSETAIASMEGEAKLKIRRAEAIKALGYDVDWERHSVADLMDMELRIRKVREMQRFGFTGDWATYTYAELETKAERMRRIAAFEKTGLNYDWQNYSLADLRDLDRRIQEADRLRKLGIPITWEGHTLKDLLQVESNYWRLHARN